MFKYVLNSIVMGNSKSSLFDIDNDNLSETYGKSIGDILSTTIKLDSLKNEDITNKVSFLL